MIKIKFKNKFFICNVNDSFNETLIYIKSLDGSKWVAEGRYWEVLNSMENANKLKPYCGEEFSEYINELIRSKIKRENEVSNKLTNKYNFLYDFQVKAMLKIINSNINGHLLSLEQGLGKTVVSICVMDYFNKTNWIVVPASLMKQWKDEIIKWIGEKEENICLCKGTKKKREELYKQNFKWDIISYETFRNDIDLIKNKLKDSVLVVDEATKLKNNKSKIYKIFWQVKDLFYYKLFLTGTPVTNALVDINNIINLIKPYMVGKISDYCIYEEQVIGYGWNAKRFMKLVGYKNLDLYVKKINPIYIRYNKKQVADNLPDKTIIRIDIEQSKKHYLMKQQILEEMTPFTGFQLLCLLDNGIEVLQKSESENVELLVFPDKYENPKLEMLKDLVEEINNQVIIFTRFIESANNIKKFLEKEFKDKKIKTIFEGDKDFLKNQFLKNEIDIIIATDKWARGVSLSNIDYLINFDIIPSLETYLQRLDRIHRIDSKNPKFIYNLVGDVIENRIMDILQNKLVLFEKIVEGKAGVIEDKDIMKEVIEQLNFKNK